MKVCNRNTFYPELKQNSFCLDYPFTEEHRAMLEKHKYWRGCLKWDNSELSINDKINYRSTFRFPVHFSNNKKFYSEIFN